VYFKPVYVLKLSFDELFGFLILTLLVPFFVIVVFNAATVFTLCRNQMRRNTVSGSRDYASVFTKLTLIAGVSFVIAFTPMIIHDTFILHTYAY